MLNNIPVYSSFVAELWIRIGIQIQHFKNPDPDPDPNRIKGFNDKKGTKN
jgi:hypothetical protein